eukprot:m.70056 g.70056  ORF g.70056 m.70056 type:complete len:56 (-) comp8622_c0_seq2:754-921(-)
MCFHVVISESEKSNYVLLFFVVSDVGCGATTASRRRGGGDARGDCDCDCDACPCC